MNHLRLLQAESIVFAGRPILELLASKKAHHFASESQDPQIKQQLEHLAEVHQRHYQMLLRHLQPQTQQQNINQYNQYSQYRN